jgi:hypothetical protein
MCAHTASSATNVIEYFEKQHGGGMAGNAGRSTEERLLLRGFPAGQARKNKTGKPRLLIRGTRS